MSREDFLERIRNMSPEEHSRTTEVAESKNPSFTRKRERSKNIRKILNTAKTLGIGEVFFYSSGAGSQEYSRRPMHHHSGPHAPVHHAPSNGTRGKGFSAYDINEIDIANARDYYKGTDGKGDHDCDHEH